MSNYNTQLQSNNTKLSTNNIDLQSLIEQANSLPDAGNSEREPVLQDKTITPSTSQQIITADSGYDGLDTVTVNAMPTATQATPSITVSSSGLITASATQTEGYVTSGTKSATKQLTTQAAKTITPSKSTQTAVSNGVYTTGDIKVAAIPNEYITTTDATASANEILNGKTAYVNGSKVTGNFTIDSELSTQDNLISQIQNAVNNLPDAGGEAAIETCDFSLTEINNAGSVQYMITTVEGYESGSCIGKTITKQCLKNSIIVLLWEYLYGATNPDSISINGGITKSYTQSLDSRSHTWIGYIQEAGTISLSAGFGGGNN